MHWNLIQLLTLKYSGLSNQEFIPASPNRWSFCAGLTEANNVVQMTPVLYIPSPYILYSNPLSAQKQ